MAHNANSLEDLKTALKDEKQAQDTAQVDKNLADLIKLIADRDKAVAEYEAAYEGDDGLKAKDNSLKARESSARTHILEELGEPGVESVGAEIAIVTTRLTDLHTDVVDAETALATAKKDQETCDNALVAASANLELWRKPTAAIKAWQKSAGEIALAVEELAAIGVHEHRQAYFLLSGPPEKSKNEMPPDEDPPKPTYGETVLAGQLKTLKGAIDVDVDGKPPVVPPGELSGRIRDAWTAFSDARAKAEGQKFKVLAAETALKAGKEALATAEASIIDDINAALKGWEHRAAECGE
ncbi:hypothetical protein [Ruegeria meonggei]|uniref:hypothetical protein n=1 Tax=Ruegeria meonggei TaxID=1446476 RepID=UPI00366E8609